MVRDTVRGLAIMVWATAWYRTVVHQLVCGIESAVGEHDGYVALALRELRRAFFVVAHQEQAGQAAVNLGSGEPMLAVAAAVRDQVAAGNAPAIAAAPAVFRKFLRCASTVTRLMR
jgi:hypothetical protein